MLNLEWNNTKADLSHIYLRHFLESFGIYGVSAGKRDQIDKKFFFEIINVLDQMIKSTSILLKNFFLKKISIWSLFPALIPCFRIMSILPITSTSSSF